MCDELVVGELAGPVAYSSGMNFDRITVDPAKLSGQPCVRGTRLTVRRVLELIALYPDRSELFREFPELGPEDVTQVLAYASTQLPDRIVDLAGVP